MPPAIHSNKESKRSDATLYFGNLEYSATDEQFYDVLIKYFSMRIHIEKIVIPTTDGRSRGYAFVTLSWPNGSPVNPEDICKVCTWMIAVNSRYMYVHQLSKKNMTSRE